MTASKLRLSLGFAFTLIVLFFVVTAPQSAYAAPTIQWTTCPSFDGTPAPANLECGNISVPLNYQKPNGEKINIAVSRMKARKPSARRGIMLLNPGGPGGVGLDMPIWMSDLMPQSVKDRYDLIGFDPRGVGRSAPVSCGVSFEKSYEIAPPMEQPGGFDATANFMHQVADGCAAHSGARLPYMTTANTARDMNQIRQAFGEAKISYFGYSYGTYLGAVYTSLFPNNSDRIVLDSATGPDADWRTTFRRWGLADEVRFPDFANFVIAGNYGLGTTLTEVKQTYFDLIAQMDQNPLPFPELGITLDGPWVRVLTFAGLYSDSNFKDTAQLMKGLKQMQGTATLQPLVSSLKPDGGVMYPDVPEDNSGASTNAVLCDDAVWSRNVEQYRQELLADTMQYPMFAVIGSHIWPCAFWSNEPIQQPVSITSNGPQNVLIIQNLRDPATPYFGGVAMRNAFGGRAKLVTVEQGGHGASYGEHNECAKTTVTNYFVTGVMPSGDLTCADETEMSQLQTAAEEKAIKKLRHRMW